MKKNEVDFYMLTNVEDFFKLMLSLLGVCGEACPNYLK